MSRYAETFRDLEVYLLAMECALEIHELCKTFPPEERYSLCEQMRRSSRSVCSNIAEAWRKRRYKAAFISKLSDSEGEAAETQCWLDFALHMEYIKKDVWQKLDNRYEQILGQLVKMINTADKWSISK